MAGRLGGFRLSLGGAARREESQRTGVNALLGGLAMVAVIALFAYAVSGNWSARSEMETYLKLGPRHGAAELARDLLQAHPRGSDIGPLFAQLSRLGFDCGVAMEPGRGGECRYRTRWQERRLATTTVTIAHDGLRVEGITAQMTLEGP